MKLASVIYLSNQEIIGYPVEYVADRLAAYVDELWLLGGDPWSYQWLTERFGDKCPGRVHAIDHTITTVGDIPNMMMKALAFVRARSEAEFILISQADEVMTAKVATLVREWMAPEHLTQARHCYCQIGFMYQYSATGWGNSIVGRDFAGEFRGDGLGFDAGGHDIGFLGDGKSCYLEIGSLTPEFYFRHQSSHVKTWREYGLMGPRLAAYPGAIAKDPLLAPWLQTPVDRDEFLRLSLMDLRKRIFGRPLVPVESVDARYTPIIEALDLRADCDYVHGMVRKFGFDK